MGDNSHQIMFIRRSNCTTMVGMLTLGVDADWCGADDSGGRPSWMLILGTETGWEQGHYHEYVQFLLIFLRT